LKGGASRDPTNANVKSKVNRMTMLKSQILDRMRPDFPPTIR
jgi:hypothetical protein